MGKHDDPYQPRFEQTTQRTNAFLLSATHGRRVHWYHDSHKLTDILQEMFRRSVPSSGRKEAVPMRRLPAICTFISICIMTATAQIMPKSSGSCGVAASGVASCNWISTINISKATTSQTPPKRAISLTIPVLLCSSQRSYSHPARQWIHEKSLAAKC